MEITILGHGCANCATLEQRVREALGERASDVAIAHITDDAEIAAAGVMRTPGLAVDGALVSTGHVPTVAWLRDALATV